MRLPVAALAAALLFAYPVHAQTKPALPPADDMEAAKAHFAAGSAYYDQANYADAVKEFNEAYRLSHRSDLLYNIAVCYERLTQYDNAIKALQQYLVDKPDAPDKLTIQTRIDNLAKLRDAQKPVEPQRPVEPPKPAVVTPTVTAPPPLAPRRKHWWLTGTVVGGAGAVVLAASLGTGLAADSIHSDLVKQCMVNGQPMTCSPGMMSKVNQGNALAIASDVLLGVGAAAVVTGAVLLIVQSRRPHAVEHARLKPTATGLAVTF